jgi:uncharacterized protein (TIGR02596 family)
MHTRSIRHSLGIRSSAPAFTLIELMVVVVIAGLLLALATPGLSRALAANRLTAAGEGLLFKVSLAQQLAVTENRPVELRFYTYTADGVDGFHAYQLFFQNQSGGVSSAIENASYLGEGSVVLAQGNLSPLLAALNNGAKTAAQEEPFKSRAASYQSMVFYPNGTTSVNLPLRQSYLTMMQPADLGGDGASVPANYYTLQIDPVTGRGRSYRP